MTSLDNYREQVREAILRRDGTALMNSSVNHASIIAQEAFNSAQDSVRILSFKLDPDCYANESVQNAMRFFLADSSHNVQILIESELWDSSHNYNWSQHPLIQYFVPYTHPRDGQQQSQLEIRRVPLSWIQRYKFNFLLIDDYGYRYEADRSRSAAVVAFLPEEKKQEIDNLQGIFSTLWDVSETIPLA